MKSPALRRFLSVFTLVSRIPLKVSFEPDLSRSDFWLPLIGIPAALTGIAGLTLCQLLFRDSLLAALGALFLEYYCFNIFHLDGLLDSADALTGHLDAQRRLEILKDSRIGGYAFFFGFFVLAASAASLALLVRLSFSTALLALVAAPVAGRSAAGLVPILIKPARSTGLGALMKGHSLRRLAFGWGLASLPLAAGALLSGQVLVGVVGMLASLAGGLCSGLLVSRLYRRGIGGFTGDALGAAVIGGELSCFLLLAAVLPRVFVAA